MDLQSRINKLFKDYQIEGNNSLILVESETKDLKTRIEQLVTEEVQKEVLRLGLEQTKEIASKNIDVFRRLAEK